MAPLAGYIIGITITTLAITSAVKAQPQSPKYNFKHLNVQNGLTQNIVYQFLQDSHGYMWIGTHNGLTLFDGIRTASFFHNEQDKKSISGNFISRILEDSAHQVWVSNESGIDLYNRTDHSFTHFGVDRDDGTKDDTYCVLLAFVSAGELWFLDTKTRAVRSLDVKTGRTSFIANLNTTNAAMFKGTGQKFHIWSSYDKGTIYQQYDNRKLVKEQAFFSGKSDPLNQRALIVSHVLQQNDTTAWLSTNEGLVRVNPVTDTYRFLNRWGKEIVTELRWAAISPKGQLWLASGPAGIYTYDLSTCEYTSNLRNNKLDPFSICSDNIVSLYFDKTGNVWCGSYGNGASYASIENVFFGSHISKNDMAKWNGDNAISWMGSKDSKNLLCLFNNTPGLWVIDSSLKIKSQSNPVRRPAGFNGNLHQILPDGPNILWCGTNRGLYRYNMSTNQMTPVPYDYLSDEIQGSGWIRDIIRLKDSAILFSTFVGLYRISGVAPPYIIKPLDFLAAGAYRGFGPLFQDKAGIVYAKSLGDTLYILKPAPGAEPLSLIASVRFMPEINYYFEDRSDTVIYLATNDGLYHINTRSYKIVKEPLNNKLPFLNVSGVLKQENKLWIFGEKGLYFYDIINKQGRTYTIEDGLPTNEFSPGALICTDDGRCVAGTANGLVSFYPGQRQDSIYPPRPRLINIYVNDNVFEASKNPNEIQMLNLSHGQNTFSFDFAPIAYQHASQCSFEFMLQGYDDTWIKNSVAHYTRYSKIPPGNYTFLLRVIDATGQVSPYTKMLAIEIRKAFWQTNLFRAGVMLFILLAAWLFTRWYSGYRVRKELLTFEKQQAIERERTRIATDMHDDLGAGLSRIKFLSQALSNKILQDHGLKSGLEKITGYSDEMTEKMGEIVWALNEKNDTLADLVAYTRSYATEYLGNHDIACQVNTPMHLPENFIAGEIRRNIFLAVKECLHNIVKHADATKVYFSVALDGNMEIVIHDNGKGIKWDNQRAFSNGLQNIRHRMKEINGNVDFVNEHGTKVMLRIPLGV